MKNDLGPIPPIFFADIVAVKDNPLTDINVIIKKVRWVMKDDKVVVVDKRKGFREVQFTISLPKP